MSNLNRIFLVGNLGHTPELIKTEKGNSVVHLSIATHKNIKTAEGEAKKETYWHRATVWGKSAEACAKYLTKGASVFVEGELQMKDWQDKEGIKRKSAEIYVDNIQFLGRAKSSDTTVGEMAVVQ